MLADFPVFVPILRGASRFAIGVALVFAATSGGARTGRAQEVLVPLVEKPLAPLSDPPISPDGAKALAIRPTAWFHAETPHFILHYRRINYARLAQ